MFNLQEYRATPRLGEGTEVNVVDKAIVREVGLRDGLQLVNNVLETRTKLAWIKAEVAAGVREFEVCSFVPPHIAAQFADAKDVVAGALEIPGVDVQALMPNAKGGQLGLQAGAMQMNYVISVSETHNQKNVRRTREQSLDDLREVVALRNQEYPDRRIGCALATAFGCTLEGQIPVRDVLTLAEKVLAIGVDEIVAPDTVGYASPKHVRKLFKSLLGLADETLVGSHFHDTRGLGLANALAALEVEVRKFDASLAGLGGCPFAPGATGNIVTEDLVFLLEAEGFDTGIDVMRLTEARAIVDEALCEEARHGNILQAGLPKGFERRAAASSQ